MEEDVDGGAVTPTWTTHFIGGAVQRFSNLSHNASNSAPFQQDLAATREPQVTIPPDIDTWNMTLGGIASVAFVLVTAGLLLGVVALQKYLRRRNQTLSEDTGVFTPRRGSKAGLDMIDNQVVLTGHSSLQRGPATIALQNELKLHLDPHKQEIVQKLLVHPP